MKVVRVSAPGKLLIAGEYVVLDGAEALVASVDRRVVVTARDGGSGPDADGSRRGDAASPDPALLPPEALLTRRSAEAELGEAVAMTLAVDASRLRHGDRKLGLGSSAAASAACAGAVLAWHGVDPATRRADVLRWALAGHRAVAPEGSGADVAASTLGGVVRFRREAPEAASVIEWPAALGLEVVWTGSPARTSDLVREVKALSEAEPSAYARATGAIREAAAALLAAIVEGDAPRAVEAAGAHGRAMGALGEAAGAAILTEELRRVATLAEAHGGAAKPSGAGGGDVALAFFADEGARQAFRRGCPEAGLTLLSLRVGAEGVSLDGSGSGNG